MARLIPVILSILYLFYFTFRALRTGRPTLLETVGAIVAMIIAGSTMYYI